jgi:hypothetical protein
MASRRVYILGAGVSAACGIPVAKDILRAAMVKLRDDSAEKAAEVHKLLAYLYPGFDRHLRTYPNIEDFLNLLEMAKQFNTQDFIKSSVWPKSRLRRVSDLTLKAVTDYLWEFMQSEEKYKVIRDFAEEAIQPGDVVITFNWDTTIEHALHLHRDEPTFVYTYSRPRKKDEITLLKPHGSIDWFRKSELPKGIKKEDLEVLDKSLAAFTRFDFRKNLSLADKTPVIVPPVSSKAFKFPFLKETWVSLYWAVSQATELYVIGYSLPPEDQFARMVLRRAIRSNVSNATKHEKEKLRVRIYNPDPAVAVAFSRVLGPVQEGFAGSTFKAVRFEDLTDALVRGKTSWE